MIKVSGHESSRENPFTQGDGRIVREFSPHLPVLDELQQSLSGRVDDGHAERQREYLEERRLYVVRWFGADSETRAKMATEEEDGGRLIVRTNTYASRVGAFNEIAGVLIDDASQFEPPVEVDAHAIDVTHYAGERFKRTYGFEVALPTDSGIVVPTNYGRITQGEYTL